MKPPNIAQQHPAEIAGPLAMAIAVLTTKLIGVEDTTVLASIAIVVSFIPALVTWIVGMVQGKQAPTAT